ncbi:MAG: hypothetical protein ACRDSF_00555 [Pseudonocardiaceae bacterium]
MNTSQVKRVTATGDVTTTDTYLRSVTLTADSDAATLVVRAGGASGTVVFTLKTSAASTILVPEFHDAFCPGGVHATFTGTSPEATFVYV